MDVRTDLDERDDVLAFLCSRKRAAETVARRNADERERAEIIAQSIEVQIEMIRQGLHVGDAIKESELEHAGKVLASADAESPPGVLMSADAAMPPPGRVRESNTFSD
ncbi:MAG: hypothetical protein EBR82_29465 [Caulobacteraceae bacterium]|nr:hypothetical protein [Caulobacteraceae bacterium]